VSHEAVAALEKLVETLTSHALKVWEEKAWRLHGSRYAPRDPGGSYRISGRYNRGRDYFGEDAVFPALYLATAPEVALGEKQRHLTSGNLPQMRNQVLSEFRVWLKAVYDLSNPEEFGIVRKDLMDDHDYAFPQSLSAALRDRGAEAFLVPSATLLGANLVVFPDRLRDGSSLEVVDSRETRLYVESPDKRA
jgi:RES domain-containing protein